MFAGRLIGGLLIAACLGSVMCLDTTCLSNSGAKVVTSASPEWQEDKSVFNRKISADPAAVVYAYNQAQVQAILGCAKAAGIRVVPRGGGHGYEGIRSSLYFIFASLCDADLQI